MKKQLLLLYLLSISCFAFAIPKVEKNALIDLYESTNGDQWLNSWNLKSSVSKWQGVVIEDNHVVSITLFNNNLSGEISLSIGDFKNLRELNLAFNKIEGQLPTGLYTLKKLQVLRLGKNKLKGNISNDINNLEELVFFDLFSNEISGELPETVCQLKNLKVLSIGDNLIEGTIPSNIGNLKNLERFEISSNKFEGEVPTSLSSLISLKVLIIAENSFSNKFPKEILSLPKLELVQIQKNKFNKTYLLNEVLTQSSLALFDYDQEAEKIIKKDITDIYNNAQYRTADTKFEDDEE